MPRQILCAAVLDQGHFSEEPTPVQSQPWFPTPDPGVLRDSFNGQFQHVEAGFVWQV